MKEDQPAASRFTQKRLGLLAFLLLVLAILAYKSYDDGWFIPRTPLTFDGEPVVLFFNRHKGCDCALVVYRAATVQMRNWPEEERQGVRLIYIDLDRRPDLGAQFNIVRAPTMLLLDRAGNVYYRQDEVISDLQPIDVNALTKRIVEMLDDK